jgi:dienelactone hydrolase
MSVIQIKPKPSFSPSDVHRHLMNGLRPAMQYSGGNISEWQARLRPKLHLLVKMPEIARAPLNVRQIWQREHPLGTIEKIIFTSEPHADIPAYICLPKAPIKPQTWMICLQGHTSGMHNSIAVDPTDEVSPIFVDGDRDFAIGCMARGVAALCIEQRAFGERRERKQEQACTYNDCLDAAMHALMLGRTMIGERVYDVDRALDYLATREDVEMGRIGVMGNSGGGTISLFSAALLGRIAFAIPSCYFCTFRDSIMSIYHCPDNFVPGLLQTAEMADILGLFAPKPVVIVAGKEDDIFPIEGTRQAFNNLQKIYAAAGAADRCHLVVGEGGHRFYAEEAWPVILDVIHGLDADKRG